ncbi:YdaU family protein [Serratia sp. T13T92]|uniref:YdaU family protein n=1 Tax=Serratia sp. T13T92 TaxID=3397496 RepID=UPI0039E0884B
MAALPYMQFYVADYLADTMHLSTEEHGAYLLLIFNYWQTGKPLPKNRLAGIARISNDRWTDVERSLNEFFIDDGNVWVHKRIERDLLSVKGAQSQRSEAGKISAQKRLAKKTQENQLRHNVRSTVVERDGNDRSTNKDPDTDKDLKDKNLLSHGEKTAKRPDGDFQGGGSADQKPDDPEAGGRVIRYEYPPDFETVWLAYPRRPGSPDKHCALKAWNARLREGVTSESMLDGTRRYSAFVVATGKSGTEFIKQAKTFFGPSRHFEDDWKITTEVTQHAEFRYNPSDQRSYYEQFMEWERQTGQSTAGMAAVGTDDQNLRPTLDCEEWQSTIGPMDGPGQFDDE